MRPINHSTLTGEKTVKIKGKGVRGRAMSTLSVSNFVGAFPHLFLSISLVPSPTAQPWRHLPHNYFQRVDNFAAGLLGSTNATAPWARR